MKTAPPLFHSPGDTSTFASLSYVPDSRGNGETARRETRVLFPGSNQLMKNRIGELLLALESAASDPDSAPVFIWIMLLTRSARGNCWPATRLMWFLSMTALAKGADSNSRAISLRRALC